MKTSWLFVDVSCLAYRNFYAQGDKMDSIMAIYGLLQDIATIAELLQTDSVAFCFDAGYEKRREVYPDYKKNRQRRGKNIDEEQSREELRERLVWLRGSLSEMGFQNIFWQDGYEADDVIAYLCQTLVEEDDAVIISTDQDFFQLLSDRVLIWDPLKKKPITVESFTKKYGIVPSDWAKVKAIAGCTSDGVLGVVGIGEKKAIGFLRGTCALNSRERIRGSGELIRRNMKLVRLPFSGCGSFELIREKLDMGIWDRAIKSLGVE